jgi:hypothetical protein
MMWTRRAVGLLAPLLLAQPTPRAPTPAAAPTILDVPLRSCGIGALCATVDLGGGARVLAVVDTASPHLTVPGADACSVRDGCAETLAVVGDASAAAFGVGEAGAMRWRRADALSFVGTGGPSLVADGDRGVIVGEPDLTLRRASGGFFFGLVGASDDAKRPPLLSQLALPPSAAPIASFRINAPGRRLVLSSAPLLARSADAIRLVDLRPNGATLRHHAARVSALSLDGVRVPLARLSRPVVCVLDTGLTCAVVSSGLVADAMRALRGSRDAQRTLARPPDEWRALELSLPTERGRGLVLKAGGDLSPFFFCATVDERALFGSEPGMARAASPGWARLGAGAGPSGRAPHFIAVGASFLDGVLTVDGGEGRAWFEPAAQL